MLDQLSRAPIMADRENEERRRPKPFDYSLFPMPPKGRPGVGAQTEAHKASDSSQQQQVPAKADAAPGGTSILRSLSGTNCTTADTVTGNLTNTERILSPRKSGYVSIKSGYNSASASSKPADHRELAVAAALAMLEGFDEGTNRARIEARSEKKLFKLTGQVPPTPTTGKSTTVCANSLLTPTGTVNEDAVFIRREDLRAQCRAVSEANQPALESVKSPKKTLFGIRNLFKRTSTEPTPRMPLKAAEVFGTVPRQHRVIQARPIMPARVLELTPTKPSRSDTTKSLPIQVANPHSYTHHHRADSPRRIRPIEHSSPDRGSFSPQQGDVEMTPATKVGVSFDYALPPTPPAKDTPPYIRVQSPLHRAFPNPHLRETYEIHENVLGEGVGLRFPELESTPLLASNDQSVNDRASSETSRPLHAEAYPKVVGGEFAEWFYPKRTDSLSKPEGKRTPPLPGAKLQTLQLPAPDLGNSRSTIAPRFYSPMDPPACPFAEGESPSKNVSPPSPSLTVGRLPRCRLTHPYPASPSITPMHDKH